MRVLVTPHHWYCHLLDFSHFNRCVGKEFASNVGNLGSIPGLEGPLKKGMSTHSSILAWRIQWTEEPGRLQSIGSQRVGHK